jgi:phosphoserine phosphatase RsbU/P
MDNRDRVAFLSTTDLLSDLPDQLSQISDEMEELRLGPERIVMEEGEPGDAVYLVVEGTLRIQREGIIITELHRGDWVGEFALIDDGPRNATAVTVSDALLLRWDRESFHTALRRSPEVASGLLKTLVRKIRQDVVSQVRASLERERMEQDLARAHEVQMGMLPKGDLVTERLEVSGISLPAAEVGGDYFDYFQPGDGTLGLILSDVIGHGFYSGLLTMMAKSCLHTQGHIDHAPTSIMEAMGRTVSLSIQSGMLMTGCYVLLDPARGTLTYCNAGHNYPYVYRGEGDTLERLQSTDPLLGIPGRESAEHHQQERPWSKGDLLVMFSDGVTEAMDSEEEMLEEEGLERVILANRDRSPAEIQAAILEAVAAHRGDAVQEDDVTMLVARAL